MKSILLTSFLVVFCLSGKAQPGALDVNFGNGGKVLTNIDQTRNVTNSVLVQSDGKIVVVGYSTPADYTGYFTLVRYNPNGSLDDNFGLNGTAETFINGVEDIAFSGVIQPDGKIIAAGYTRTAANYDFAMVRFNPDGTRDLSFGTNGIVTTDWAGNEKANKILLQGDGKILLVGYVSSVDDIDMAVARYNADGSLDQSFASNGVAQIDFQNNYFWQAARAACLQNDGKIVLAGYTDVLNEATQSFDSRFGLLRLNTSGVLDTTFGVDGILISAFGAHDVAIDVAETEDGKLLVLGSSKLSKGGTDDFLLARYLANGTIDNSFGNAGATRMSFDNSDDIPCKLIIQSDQKLLVGGYTARNNGSTLDFALARLTAAGVLDNTFGTSGKVITDFFGDWDFAGSMAVQKNGKIIMAGFVRSGTDYDFGLVRFTNDAALPVTLTAFNARREENGVLISWRTSSELNSDYFEIQKSGDGVQWIVIDRLEANRITSANSDYLYTDLQPAAGKNYYRLKMVDFDQSFAYSSIVSVNFNGVVDVLNAYPNPTCGVLKLRRTSINKISSIQIFDVKGNSIPGFHFTGNDINLSALSNGLYNIVVTDEHGGVEKCKVILNK